MYFNYIINKVPETSWEPYLLVCVIVSIFFRNW